MASRFVLTALSISIFATPRNSSAQIRPLRPMDSQQRLLEIDRQFPGFGGFWYDPDGNVHVAIGNLADSTKIQAIVATELSRREGQRGLDRVLLHRFIFHQSKFGYTDLWNWQCEVGKIAVDSVPGYQSAGVRVQINKIHFGVVDQRGIAALKKVTRSLEIPDEAIQVELEAQLCSAEARPGIVIFPTDSATGEVLIGGSHFFAREVSFIDSVTAPRTVSSTLDHVALVHERAGFYDVGIDHVGYKPWRQTVLVEKDACHVTPVQITARLVRK